MMKTPDTDSIEEEVKTMTEDMDTTIMRDSEEKEMDEGKKKKKKKGIFASLFKRPSKRDLRRQEEKKKKEIDMTEKEAESILKMVG